LTVLQAKENKFRATMAYLLLSALVTYKGLPVYRSTSCYGINTNAQYHEI
jgi:hypothetical protein